MVPEDEGDDDHDDHHHDNINSKVGNHQLRIKGHFLLMISTGQVRQNGGRPSDLKGKDPGNPKK